MMRFIALLALAGSMAVAAAQDPAAASVPTKACEFSETAIPAASTGIELLAVDPPDGGEVRRDSIVGVDVEFHLEGADSLTYSIKPLFVSVTVGETGIYESADEPVVHGRHGRAHLCVPLAILYERRQVAWPLKMHVLVSPKVPDSRAAFVDSKTVTFHALDTPVGALERTAAAPPRDYQVALNAVFQYLESQAAVYQSCIARFPDGQAGFTKVYRAWEARNAATIAQVDERQFALFQFAADDVRYATLVYDLARSAQRQQLSALPDSELRRACSFTQRALSDEDGDPQNAVRDELKKVRSHILTHPDPKT